MEVPGLLFLSKTAIAEELKNKFHHPKKKSAANARLNNKPDETILPM